MGLGRRLTAVRFESHVEYLRGLRIQLINGVPRAPPNMAKISPISQHSNTGTVYFDEANVLNLYCAYHDAAANDDTEGYLFIKYYFN